MIKKQPKFVKLIILIHYIYDELRKAARLLAFGFEAGEDRVRTMDKNGNTTQKGSWTYTYDYKNKIVKATNGTKTISFEYDPFGRRIKKDTGSTAINYYYASDQVIEEQNSSGSTLKQYIYGNLIDEIIRMDKYNNNQIENSFYYHTDSIGNVTAITDKDGNIIERYKYNIYGSPTITDNTGNPINESAIGNDYMFQSRRYDPELKLYYYRARTYDPQIGRFLQTDPMGYRDSMNLYQAMNMNGWGFVDPWGLLEYKWNWMGRYIGKIVNKKLVLEPRFPGGIEGYLSNFPESSGSKRFEIPLAIIFNNPIYTYINYKIVKTGKKYKIEFSFKMSTFIYMPIKDKNNKRKYRHEKSHILGYQLMFLKVLYKLRKAEEKEFKDEHSALKYAGKIWESCRIDKIKNDSNWYPKEDSVWEKILYLFFMNPHEKKWENWASQIDPEKVWHDILNFEETYKEQKEFNIERYKRQKNDKWEEDLHLEDSN